MCDFQVTHLDSVRKIIDFARNEVEEKHGADGADNMPRLTRYLILSLVTQLDQITPENVKNRERKKILDDLLEQTAACARAYFIRRFPPYIE